MKTRTMMADALTACCPKFYDPSKGEWIEKKGAIWPVLFISTELDIRELTTMAVAYLTGIPEGDLLLGKRNIKDDFVVQEAADILKNAPIMFEVLFDYNIKDVENCIKRCVRKYNTQLVFMDYLNSSLGLISESAQKTRGVAMREDNILSLFSTRLKELAVELNIFILTATQTNASAKTDPIPDSNLIKGSRAISEKTDFGSIILPLSENDNAALDKLCESGYPRPNLKLSVFKNRQGSFVRGYLWLQQDNATCRYRVLFATDWDYNVVEAPRLQIVQAKEFKNGL